MPVTPDYGFRYPAYGDTPDAPRDLQNVAEDVETEFNRRGLVGRNDRTSDVNIPSSEPGQLLMSTSAAVRNGRSYVITAHTEVVLTSGTIDGVSNCQFELYYTVDGSEPSAADSLLGRAIVPCLLNNTAASVHLEGLHHADGNYTLSVVLNGHGVTNAAHAYKIEAEPDFPSYIIIEDMGPTPAVTGTDHS